MGLVRQEFGPFKVTKWLINYSVSYRDITAIFKTLEDTAKMHHSYNQSKSDVQSLTYHLRNYM